MFERYYLEVERFVILKDLLELIDKISLELTAEKLRLLNNKEKIKKLSNGLFQLQLITEFFSEELIDNYDEWYIRTYFPIKLRHIFIQKVLQYFLHHPELYILPDVFSKLVEKTNRIGGLLAIAITINLVFENTYGVSNHYQYECLKKFNNN
ncbi:MAG: hypothetical protein [Bacteriophage sp.]|nr:MAG: hypothetical protein [Bacteriophage sp.]